MADIKPQLAACFVSSIQDASRRSITSSPSTYDSAQSICPSSTSPSSPDSGITSSRRYPPPRMDKLISQPSTVQQSTKLLNSFRTLEYLGRSCFVMQFSHVPWCLFSFIPMTHHLFRLIKATHTLFVISFLFRSTYQNEQFRVVTWFGSILYKQQIRHTLQLLSFIILLYTPLPFSTLIVVKVKLEEQHRKPAVHRSHPLHSEPLWSIRPSLPHKTSKSFIKTSSTTDCGTHRHTSTLAK